MSRIPLHLRVPNPPATFLGREQELRAIAGAMKRGNVVVVCGVGGLGKTSLVSAAVKTHLASRLNVAVMIGLRPQPLQQSLVEIVRALAQLRNDPAGRADDPADANWSAMASEEELITVAIDLAEEHEAVVVLDDLHHAFPGAHSLLLMIARYARRSLWLATSRIEPAISEKSDGDELGGQIVRLGALPDKKLAELARLIDPQMKKDALAANVEAAGGSPWRLRRLLSSALGQQHLVEKERESPLEGIGGSGRAILEALFVAERPLDFAILTRIVRGVADVADANAVMLDLVRRGLAEIVGETLRLHEAGRPWVAEKLTSDVEKRKIREHVAAALAESGSLPELLEALRLLIEVNDEEAALAICDRQGAHLLRAGYAPTLWKLLELRDNAAWYPWKLRAGLQVAEVDVISKLGPPRPESANFVDRLLWTRALFVAGRAIEADEACALLIHDAQQASGDAEQRRDIDIVFWAGLVRAMAVHNHAGAEKGVAILRATQPSIEATSSHSPIAELGNPAKVPVASDDGGQLRLLRDLILAFWLVECGEPDRAMEIVDAIPRSTRGATATANTTATSTGVDVLGAPVSFFIRFYRFATLMECGRLEEAHAVISATADLGEEQVAARIAGNALANLAIARGQLDEAKTRLERLRRRSAPPAFADVTALLSLERRLAAGELANWEADLDALVTVACERTPLVHAWCVDTRERYAIAVGSRLDLDTRTTESSLGDGSKTIDAAPASASAPSPSGHLDDLPLGRGTRAIFALRRELRAVRWGNGAAGDVHAARDVEGRIALHSILATRALLTERFDVAIEEARRAVDIAAKNGWGIRELEARVLLAECMMMSSSSSSSSSSVEAAIRTLAERAATFQSPRFLVEGSLLALSNATSLDFPALEKIAKAQDVAPCAARRARALLGDVGGDDDHLDAIDRAVLAHCRVRKRVRVRVLGTTTTTKGSQEWHRGWGVDVDKKLLYRADATTVPLERHALLLKMLLVLADHDGAATFEQIAEAVWRVKSFHPLKDTNRVRVTMHRLRALVETSDSNEPKHIVLRDGSYAIGEGPFRIIETIEAV